MRRIFLVLAVAALMAVMLAASSGAALAQGQGCPGQFVREQAHDQVRDEVVKAGKAAFGTFGEAQSTFNHLVCGHGKP